MPRYQLENFRQNVVRLQSYLERNKPRDLCAIVDVGTKATKLLVGPKKAPSQQTWSNTAFFNDGQLFPLGSDFDLYRGRLDIKSSGALEGVCYFIDIYRRILTGSGMAEENMQGVGTAVFRWMNNQEEVVGHICKQTGLAIRVLQQSDEAFLSCFSILNTYSFGTTDEGTFGDNDVILLFDQGGGSTEVSYFSPKRASMAKLDSLHKFGTVSLQKMFFDLRDRGTDTGGPPDPTKNRNRISTQFGRVKEYLVERVEEWPGFPELGRDNVKIHAYGMGTALSKALRGGSSFSHHNRLLTIRDMEETLGRECQELDNSRQEVRTLFAALKQERETGGKALSDRMVMLYGLPVYQQLLAKFGLDRLRFAGFGLRYGAYFWVCSGKKLDDLTAPKGESVPTGQVPKAERVRVFLSHTGADNELAKRIAGDLEKAEIAVWIDNADMLVGEGILPKITKAIDESQYLVALLSKKSLESKWVMKEVNMAMTKELNRGGIRFLGILAEDCQSLLPLNISDGFVVNFSNNYLGGMEKLLHAINSYK